MTETKVEYRPLKKRKHVSSSLTIKRKTGCGNMYVAVSYDDDYKLGRVTVTLGRNGSCRSAYCAGLGEMASLLFQGNFEPEIIIDRLKNISCGTPHFVADGDEENNASCCDAIARGLEIAIDTLKEMKEAKEEKKEDKK